jgi:hypothetical protein
LLDEAAVDPEKVWLKVAQSGGVSAYGLGRFPVTLYYQQWLKLLANKPKLLQFLTANKAALKLKKPPAGDA